MSWLSFTTQCSSELRFLFLLAMIYMMAYKSFSELDSLNLRAGMRCIEIERKAFLAIKAGFEDPEGGLSSWVGENCCSSWEGVGCNNITGHVEKLDLDILNRLKDNITSNRISTSRSGQLSPSIVDLKYLRYLDLSNNDFQMKSMPEFIGSLEKLTYLDLSCSLFGGVFPRWLGNLPQMTHLKLDYRNCFDEYQNGDLYWLSGLSSLQYLSIQAVNLQDASDHWLQTVNTLQNLKELRLSGCQLASLPQILPDMNFSSLSTLDLSDNYFNSTLPQWLFNISTLEYLDMSFSRIRGQLKYFFSENTCNLQTIYLADNFIGGGLAELLDLLASCTNSIRILGLRNNDLSGPFSDSITELSNLRVLDLAGNNIFGSIPDSVGSLLSLNVFDISYNYMNGTIPSSIGQLYQLQELYLSDNSWQGSISEIHFRRLVNLKSLNLSCSDSLVLNNTSNWNPSFDLHRLVIFDCKLGSSWPAWLANQTNLSELVLANVSLVGAFPDWLSKLTPQLRTLDLSNNQLFGELPSSFHFGLNSWVNLGGNQFKGSLPKVYNASSLTLSNNNFSGSISSDLDRQSPKLFELDISGNMVTRSIPSLNNLYYLDTLNLANNKLSGNIPDNWEVMSNLFSIDLSENNLSGSIPSTLCSNRDIQVLRFNKNNLSGEVSTRVFNYTQMLLLDLGENSFSGNISGFKGGGLQALGLQFNLFSGELSEEICSLTSLHVLDLAQNKISGSIPSCIGNMIGFYQQLGTSFHTRISSITLTMNGIQLTYEKNLTSLPRTIDLSDNNLSGQISEKITNFSLLMSLNLSRNYLTGPIPNNIGKLQELVSLDLSHNHLSGSIPRSLASLTFLSKLNFSHNNLSGKIPTSNQLQTLDASAFEDNPGLCGSPLLNLYPTLSTGTNNDRKEDANVDGSEKMWLYITIVLEFLLGLWAVCGNLAIKKSWRDAYFHFLKI